MLIVSALTACLNRTVSASNPHTCTMKVPTNSVEEIRNFIKLNPSKIELFWSKVDRNGPVTKPNLSPCWDWKGKVGPTGYGFINGFNNPLRCHRLSFVLHGGILTEEKGHVLHSCDRPCCVNPDHLRAGDQRENNADKMRAGRQSKGKKHSEAVIPFVPRGEEHSKRMKEILPRGESHHNAVLTEGQVREIRARYAKGGVFHRQLAMEYGVSRITVGEIIRNQIWTHII
jgi:hypothetical protein